jgi:small subunit ribosomal protein S17
MAETKAPSRNRKTLIGIVSSDKMSKTVVVTVSLRVRHAMYKKYISRTLKYKAHDENNEAKVGDRVLLVETRPLSREKRWRVQKILEKAV